MEFAAFTGIPGWRAACPVVVAVGEHALGEDVGDPLTSISTAIRRYVAEHPHAADSVDGVRSWWVPAAAGHVDPRTVERALEQLVSEGVITRRTLPDGTVIYSGSRPRGA